MSGLVGHITRDQIREVRAAHDPADLLARYTEVQRAGGDWVARCPVHGERTASLHVYAGRETDGKPYQCFGCGWHGDQIDLVQAVENLTWREAFDRLSAGIITPPVVATRPLPAPCRWRPVLPVPADAPPPGAELWGHKRERPAYGGRAADRVFIYRDEAGRMVGAVLRYNLPDGRKMTPTATWCEADGMPPRWVDLPFPEPRPLYGLDLLAARPDAPVLVVEGEKACDAARALLPELVCVTSPGGSNGTRRVDWSPLAGRDVRIWPDADDAGAKYARAIAEDGPGGRILDLSGLAEAIGGQLPKGFDAADVPVDCRDAVRSWVLAVPQLPPPPQAEHHHDPEDANAYHRRVVLSLERYLDERGLAPDAMEGLRQVSDWSLARASVDSLAREFCFDFRQRGKVSCQYATETLEVIVGRRRAERRATLIADIAQAPTTDAGRAALRAWIAAVVDERAPTALVGGDAIDLTMRELAELAVLHWMRNCKRLALGLRPEHDIMVVLHGPQGSGKTTAVERLVAPWRELAVAVDASYLTDDRRAPALAQAIVGRWEEMSGARKADIEALKNAITAQTIAWRPMRTNCRTEQPKTISLIGSSNITIDQMVADVTGARRFIQLTTPAVCDWRALNAIDPLLLWQAIGPDDPCDFAARLGDIRRHQADLVHRDPIAMWWDNETWERIELQMPDIRDPIIWPAYDPKQGMPFDEIAHRFGHWCRLVNQPALGTRLLSQRLPQLGVIVRQPRNVHGRPRRYYLPEGHLAVTRVGEVKSTTAIPESYDAPPF